MSSLPTTSSESSIVDVICLCVPPVALVWCALASVPYAGVLSFVVVIAACIAMLIVWETSAPTLDTILLSAVLGALAAAGRLVFAALPSVQPVTALCVLAGCMLGRRAGFMTGALAALVSNCFLGQGVWTPWQMYAWGLVGYIAGALFAKRQASTWAVVLFGALGSFVFGAVMNTWSLFGFVHPVTWQAALAVYGAGVVLDTVHAASTVAFLIVLYAPWQRKFERIRKKYAAST